MKASTGIFLILLIFCGGLILVPGIVPLLVLLSGEFVSTVLPAKYKPSFYAEIIAKLIVDGEAVNIRRVVECETVVIRGGGLSRGTRRATKFKVNVGAIGVRLKTGGAIMMWTPYRCAHDLVEDSNGKVVRRVSPNTKNYIPFMAWTPDAHRLNVLELYPARAYFEKPNARIKLVNLTVRDAPIDAEVDPPDEFEWFSSQFNSGRSQRIWNEKRIRGRRFMGVYAFVLEEKDWKGRNKLFDETLGSKNHLWAIARESDARVGPVLKTAWKLFEEKLGVTSTQLGHRLPTLFRTYRVVSIENREWNLRDLPKMTRSPLDNRDYLEHVQVLNWDQTGAIDIRRDAETSFYRLYGLSKPRRVEGQVKLTSAKLPNGAEPKHPAHTTWKRGKRLLRPELDPDSLKRFAHHDSRLLYDPETQEIYWLFTVDYRASPRANTFPWF